MNKGAAHKNTPQKKMQPTGKRAPVPATKNANTPYWFTAFLFLLVLVPLPFGANRPWASDLFGVATGAVLLLMLLQHKADTIWSGPLPRYKLWGAAICFSLAVIWSFVQVMPFVPTLWQHPIWAEGGKLLGTKGGTISVNPGLYPEALIRLLSYMGCFILAFVGGRDNDNAARMLKYLAYAAGGYALYGLFVQSTGTETVLWFKKWAYQGFLTSTFVNKNSYAAYAGLGLLCALGLTWRKLSHITIKDRVLAKQSQVAAFFVSLQLEHFAFLLLCATVLAALILTGSRAGIASSLIGSAGLFLAIAVNKRISAGKWMFIIGLFMCFFVLFIAIGGDALTERLGSENIGTASSERLAGYRLALQAIMDNPWLGFGLGSFEEAFRLYRDSSLPVLFHHAHNDYLELAMDLGLPAAILFLAGLALLVGCCLSGVWKRKRSSIYPCIAVGATLLLMCHALADFSFQIPAIAATYAALLGLGVAQSWSTRHKEDVRD